MCVIPGRGKYRQAAYTHSQYSYARRRAISSVTTIWEAGIADCITVKGLPPCRPNILSRIRSGSVSSHVRTTGCGHAIAIAARARSLMSNTLSTTSCSSHSGVEGTIVRSQADTFGGCVPDSPALPATSSFDLNRALITPIGRGWAGARSLGV